MLQEAVQLQAAAEQRSLQLAQQGAALEGKQREVSAATGKGQEQGRGLGCSR